MMPGRRIVIAVFAAFMVGALAAPSALGCDTGNGHRILVNYRRAGGLGGGDARLIVMQGGHTMLTSSSGTHDASLGPATRQRISRALRRAIFASLESDYESPAPVPDAFSYTITHGCHTVHAVDTAVPSRLQAVIGILDRIVTRLTP
jgi:hypothetical protein